MICSRPVRLSVLSAVLETSLQAECLPRFGVDRTTLAAAPQNDDDELLDDELLGSATTGAQHLKALRTLLAVSVELQSSLRAMLVNGSHSCDLCSSANEVRVMVTDVHGPMPYDCVMLDWQLLGHKAVEVVKDLHQFQLRNANRKRLVIIGIVEEADSSANAALVAAGIDAVFSRPLDQMKVQHAIARGAASASARLEELTKRATASLQPVMTHAATAATHPVVVPEAAAALEVAVEEEGGEDGVKRVLVVEDDAGQQRVFKSFLSKEGYEVEIIKEPGRHSQKVGSTLI